MTYQQKKSRRFAYALREYENYKRWLQAQGLSPQEYEEAIKRKAKELDI